MRFVPLLLVPAVLSFATQSRADDEWFGPDKALHFGASLAIATGSYAVGTKLFDKRPAALVFGGTVTIAIGAGKEGWDAMGHGDPSWRDFTWDVVGAAVGLGIGYGIDLLVSPRTAH